MSIHPGKSAAELSRYTGNMKQIAGVERVILDDGKARGIRAMHVYNDTGLEYDVLLDRGMDIGQARYKGVNLAYMTPTGYANPAFYEEEDVRWLRNWHAGLLTGCGFQNVGIPQSYKEPEPNGPSGLHGRLSNTPAEQCAGTASWQNDEYVMEVTGKVRTSSFFGENLVLTRSITTTAGTSRLVIKDTVRNEGYRPAPLMFLYHINAGYPLLTEQAVLTAEDHEILPRDDHAAQGIDHWQECTAPQEGIQEQCYFHDIPADSDGMAHMSLENQPLGLALTISCRKKELPLFNQWKMMGAGEYVMGIEPCNCRPDGRAAERQNGTLHMLEPQEARDFHVEIAVREL